MHAIGGRLSSAMDLNDPDRIMTLVEWELKKKEEAEEMEKKRAEKEAKKKERALNAKLKEDAKNMALKAQVNIVAFLNAIGRLLPPDFDGTKDLVAKSVMVKFVSAQHLGGKKWKEWLASQQKIPTPVNSKQTTVKLIWTYINYIRKSDLARVWVPGKDTDAE
jgi:hypothetical protein